MGMDVTMCNFPGFDRSQGTVILLQYDIYLRLRETEANCSGLVNGQLNLLNFGWPSY